jgi:RNA:NAD 2'-phosphotransferase (TPT1/KptA family)
MKKKHVHFARGSSTNNGVISKMPNDCEFFIYLHVQKDLQYGMKLFIYKNKVILT